MNRIMLRLLSFAFLAGAMLWAIPAINAQNAQPTPDAQQAEVGKKVEATRRACGELIAYARIFKECFCFNEAQAMYETAIGLGQTLNDQDLNMAVQSDYAIFWSKIGKKGEAARYTQSIPGTFQAVQNPQILALMHIALGWGALGRNDWKTVNDEAGKAVFEGARAGDMRSQAEGNLLKGEGQYLQNQFSDALESANKALKLSPDPLYQSEPQQLIARTYLKLNDKEAADSANRKGLNSVPNLDSGPYIDAEKTLKIAPQLLRDHIDAGRQQNWKKAFNITLSLFVLKDKKFTDDKQAMVLKLQMSEGLLLAYMSYYLHMMEYPAPASVLYNMSNQRMLETMSSNARVQQKIVGGRYLRATGQPQMAIDLLDKAKAMLERQNIQDPNLQIELNEERGFTLLQMGRPETALASLRDGLTIAQQSQQPIAIGRIQRYLKAIEKDKVTDVNKLLAPEQAVVIRKTMPAMVGPLVFQSPFVDDYPEGSVKSASDAILAMSLSTPTPTPTPQTLTPEILMNSNMHARAIPVLEDILKKEGDSVDRLMQLGVCYQNTKDWDKAEGAFKRVLKMDPSNAPAKEYLEGLKRIRASRAAAGLK